MGVKFPSAVKLPAEQPQDSNERQIDELFGVEICLNDMNWKVKAIDLQSGRV